MTLIQNLGELFDCTQLSECVFVVYLDCKMCLNVKLSSFYDWHKVEVE